MSTWLLKQDHKKKLMIRFDQKVEICIPSLRIEQFDDD